MIPSILLVGLLALSITSVIPFTRANPIPGNDTSLAVRQYGIFDHHNDCCKTNCKLEPAKGKTKTIWKFEQLTAWNDAGDGAAEVAFTESYTSSYTISGGFNVGFISAGLDVTESWTTGKTYTCIGAPMKKVCVWMRVPHRVYAVAAPQDAKICNSSPL
ncbi:hypothetical protein BJ875DRAFT_484805 [Amylocarpus encephaloides]|uniref:Uncharacterized protein n=1 Tax=Amylocarpus encephaloides TaxID=45428 RepID=A0A9P7YHB6_9HELO|nr:hypothetical protein BJ875DRAFT_484805 [Amylocarpus encephaloides]